MPELRKDPVVDRWVILAPERDARPSEYAEIEPPRIQGPCPFCPGREGETPHEILSHRERPGDSDSPGWGWRVIPNRYPALRVDCDSELLGDPLFERLDGFGAHEVLVEGPDHDLDLSQLPEQQVAAVLGALRARMTELARDPRIRAVVAFENRGAVAGATLEHPHAQLLATPLVPKAIEEEIEAGRRYHENRGRCVYCDLIRRESGDMDATGAASPRLVARHEGFAVVAAYAPRFAYETWILPLAHHSSYERGDEAQDRALARALRDTLGRLGRALDHPAYNFVIHTAPSRSPDLPHYHWHLEVLPRTVRLAGFEWGSGLFVNSTPPETAAARLREAAPVEAMDR